MHNQALQRTPYAALVFAQFAALILLHKTKLRSSGR